MKVPAILTVWLLAMAAAATITDHIIADGIMLIALVAAAGSFFIMLWQLFRHGFGGGSGEPRKHLSQRRSRQGRPARAVRPRNVRPLNVQDARGADSRRPGTRPAPPVKDADPVVIDGSNVLYWADGKPDIAVLSAVLRRLAGQGQQPQLWFDANAGYLISDCYWGPWHWSQALGLEEGRIHVAPRGQPADPLILEMATKLGAPIITRDRYRDWQEHYAILQEPGWLWSGTMRDGQIVWNSHKNRDGHHERSRQINSAA